MSLKNPVTPAGIDPGTVRLVAQRLNHYATPDPVIDGPSANTLSSVVLLVLSICISLIHTKWLTKQSSFIN